MVRRTCCLEVGSRVTFDAMSRDTSRRSCGHTTETPSGTTWTCIAPPHGGDRHVYSNLGRGARSRRGGPTISENRLEALFHAEMRRIGGTSLKLAPIRTGTADRLAIFPGGGTCLVELKTTHGAPSPAQVVFQERMQGLGMVAVVLYGPDEVRAWVPRTYRSLVQGSDTTDDEGDRVTPVNGLHQPARLARYGRAADVHAAERIRRSKRSRKAQ